MAETEVSKEVSKMVATEEKCGLDMSSYQDLPKPDCNGTSHHNQTNDLDNSYVFVTGADGHPDDAVDNKDEDAEGSSVLPESKAVSVKDQGAELDSQNEKLDAVSGEIQPLNEGENRNVYQINRDPTLVNDSTWKHESSHEDGEGVQVSVADSLEDNGKTENSAEAEVKQVEDPDGKIESSVEAEAEKTTDQNGKIGVAEGGHVANSLEDNEKTESSAEAEVKQVEDPDGKIESSVEAEAEKTTDQNGKIGVAVDEHVADSLEDNGKTESSAEAEFKQVEDPDGKIESSVEAEAEKTTDQNGKIGVAEDEHVADSLEDNGKTESLAEAEFKQVEDPGGKIESSVEADVEKTTDQNGKIGVAEGEHVADSLEDNGKTESSAEAEVKQVEDPDGQIESSVEADVEKTTDQNGKIEGVVEGEHEKFNDVKSESPPGHVENQESEVGALGLVAESGDNGQSDNILSQIIISHNANDECEDQSNFSVTEASEACQGSQDAVMDVVECELQDVSMEADDEEKSTREVAEAADHEVSPSTSLELDLESYPVSNKDETLEEEAKTTLSLDVFENQQGDTAVGNNVQDVLGQIDESKTVVSSTDCHVQTVCNLVLEKKDENFGVSEVDNGVQYPEEPDEQPDGSGVSHDTTPSETKTEASVQTQSYPASNAHAPQTEIEISDAETIGAVSFPPVDGPKSQIIEKVFPGHDSEIRCTSNEASSGSDFTLDMVVLTEEEPTFRGGEAHAENEVSSGKAEVIDNPPATFDVKLEPEVHVYNFSAINTGEKTDDVAVSYRTEVSDSFNVNKEGAANIVLEIEGVEDMGDQLDGAAGNSNENLFVQENEDTGNSHCKKLSAASAGGSSANMIDGEEESIKTITKPFNFLIRIPRFDDENLREQIRLAKLHVDEKTKLRDAIQVQIQEKRANSQIHGIDYEYAKGEGRSARKLVRSKRMEIDSLQFVINKAKNALSIEDIDSQIYNMEHMIQHETLPLKEEKQFIREIKQLKQLREQLSSNMGSQDEIKQALEQREEVEERLKILRKELDILKNRVLKAEATAAEAGKKYDDENKKVKELQAQFKAADDVRQAAYAQWQSLRKELSKKRTHFFKYKEDAAVASKYTFSRDPEALYCLCMNQVENFMELWNTNDEFRREYVKFNARSTVRRLGTLDGRSLSPDEVPPILPSYADERVNRMASTPVKVDLASQISSLELKQETTNENVTLDGKSMNNVTEPPKNQKVTKGPAITVQVNGRDALSGMDLIAEVYEEPIKSRDEIESIRKEEEMRREEAEAKLKEQRRLEALAKANEARERKKRQAEKLQIRAELKTQKEAEQKEKEREKRLRKKERKKAGVTDANDVNNNCETAPSSDSAVENSKDIDVKDMSSAAPKKPQKPWLFTKQSKAKSVPPPFRNRNKKKLQQWMWVGITSFIILVLFWLGNIGVFSNVTLKRRSPVH